MTELNKALKTLKDLTRTLYDETDSEVYREEIVSADDLRQEAIKWVKLKLQPEDEKVYTLSQALAKKTFMDFFNITEEDLNGRS